MLIVMQGASGSGKSTEAAKLSQQFNAVIVSTDDEFTENGVYTFNVALLGVNHNKTQQKAAKLLAEGKNVIVDNTNLQRWECRPYVEAALKHGHEVQFVRCEGTWQNVHGVPQDRVEMMRRRMEDLTVENVMASKKPF
jgi:predicted kinase